jgi:hypothetical protein
MATEKATHRESPERTNQSTGQPRIVGTLSRMNPLRCRLTDQIAVDSPEENGAKQARILAQLDANERHARREWVRLCVFIPGPLGLCAPPVSCRASGCEIIYRGSSPG